MSDIVCPVCFRHCRLSPGQTGFCRARRNENGKSVCTSYGKISAMALDPVEKKPLAHFFPGSKVLSVGSFGCNMNCPFCQNDSISRAGEDSVEWRNISPEELADIAHKLIPQGNIGAAFTYNEPLVAYEYVRDAARIIKSMGMKNVIVTNGAFCTEILDELLPLTDAFNIDLKGFSNEWYGALGGELETVKVFIQKASKDAHVELTTLIVPGGNDSEEDMRNLARWVASLDASIPLHITRFFPRYQYSDRNPTDVVLLKRLSEIAKESLESVFIGNV